VKDGIGDGEKCGVGLIEGHAGWHARYDGEPPGMDAGVDVVAWCVDDGVGGERRVDLGALGGVGADETVRHDSDDREGNVGDDELAANGLGRALKPAAPEALTDNYREAGGAAAVLVVCWCEITAEEWRGLQCFEVLATDEDTVDVFVA